MRTQIDFTITNSSEQDAKKSITSKRLILWPSEQPLDTIQMKKKNFGSTITNKHGEFTKNIYFLKLCGLVKRSRQDILATFQVGLVWEK